MPRLRHGLRSRACSPFIGAALLLALVLASAPARAVTDDQNLTGLAYLSDGTPLSATAWADNTPFAVWVNHTGSWATAWRYPASGWYATSGGAYSVVLPGASKDVDWGNGDAYRIEFDVSAITGILGRTDNGTSHGTGDPGEFPPAGATENAIVWAPTDNWQRWDVVLLARPDVSVDPGELRITPPGPVAAGTLVTVNATARNLGNRDARNVAVRFTDGAPPGTPIGGDATIPSLAAGASAMVERVWTATPAGTHRLCVAADPDDVIAESNETNNIGCSDIVVEPAAVTRPDLVLEQAQPVSPLRAGLSQPLALSVQVRNQGNASAAPSVLTFYNATMSTSPFATFPVSALAPGEVSARFTAPWTSPSAPATYRVVATADYTDALAEWDEANNVHEWTIDVVAGPVTTLVVGTPSYPAVVWYIVSSTDLTFTVLDQSGTGLRRTTYRVDNGTSMDFGTTGPFRMSGEGEHYLEWFSEDNASNVEPNQSAILRVDDSPPAMSVQAGAPSYQGPPLYVASATPFAVQGTDTGPFPVGLASVEYRIDGGPWTPFSGPFTLPRPDGAKLVEYAAFDHLGNGASGSMNPVLDDTPPRTTVSPGVGPYTPQTIFLLTSVDSGSGVSRTEYRIDGGVWISYGGGFTLPLGDHAIGYRSADRLDNTEAVHTLPVSVGVASPEAANWKPAISAVFSLLIVVALVLRRRRGADPRSVLLHVPFVVVEASTGALSWATGVFAVPPWIGLGVVVNVAILCAGILLPIPVGRRPSATSTEPSSLKAP